MERDLVNHPNRKKSKRGSAESAVLKRWFGELEVVEAKKELRVQPNEEDIISAVKNDPRQCVFSRACQRMWSSTAVVFFRTVAYVDLLDSAGKRRLERFSISSAGQRMIRDFDAGKKIDPKGFVLLPPSASATTDRVLQYGKESKERKRQALMLGKSTSLSDNSKYHSKKRKPSLGRLSMMRNGGGMVHFPAEK